MNEFGVDLFPYKEEKNHYCGASWPVWTVGIAATANAEGDLDLVTKLIAQQTRHAIVHKTFYESMEMDTGMAWRWPGQLWHAAAYISYYLYGILGITYDATGLYFHPAVPELFQNLSVENFAYRRACLTIKIKGWGEHWNMLLDGEKADYIPADIAGAHEVQFVCSKEMK